MPLNTTNSIKTILGIDLLWFFENDKIHDITLYQSHSKGNVLFGILKVKMFRNQSACFE